MPTFCPAEHVRKRADFELIYKTGFKRSGRLMTMFTREREAATPRLGIAATRKMGPAVERNRAKRRLRAAVAELLPLLGRKGHDYVLVAKVATLSRPYAALLADLTKALTGAHAELEANAKR